MNTKKKLGVIAAIGLSGMLLFSACSSSPQSSADASSAVVSAATSISVTDLADALNSGGSYGETLTELDGGGLERVYRVEEGDYANAAGYTGSGATVDQISVWEAPDDAAADRIYQTLQDFVKAQIESYTDYKPDEVPKLEDAVLKKQGKYVVLCVSEDAQAAESIIGEYLAG